MDGPVRRGVRAYRVTEFQRKGWIVVPTQPGHGWEDLVLMEKPAPPVPEKDGKKIARRLAERIRALGSLDGSDNEEPLDIEGRSQT